MKRRSTNQNAKPSNFLKKKRAQKCEQLKENNTSACSVETSQNEKKDDEMKDLEYKKTVDTIQDNMPSTSGTQSTISDMPSTSVTQSTIYDVPSTSGTQSTISEEDSMIEVISDDDAHEDDTEEKMRQLHAKLDNILIEMDAIENKHKLSRKFKKNLFRDDATTSHNATANANINEKPKKKLKVQAQVHVPPTERAQANQHNQNIIKIKDVTNLSNEHFTIQGKVVFKTNIYNYENSNSKGKFFKFILKDDSSEILVTAFNEKAQQVFEIIKMDHCFILSKGNVKEANKQYNRTEHAFEITLIKTSLLREVSAETFNHLDEQLEFTNFSELKILPEDTLVNVKGKIVEAFDDIGLSSLKKNKPLRKKSIIIQNEKMVQIK
nr:PREDICTED: replication protein A 70 kDa DNA-binding subunit-like [Bemisia tabaci]